MAGYQKQDFWAIGKILDLVDPINPSFKFYLYREDNSVTIGNYPS